MNDIVNKHGGKRSGAGRKPGSTKNSEKTIVVRIPESQKSAVFDFISAKANLNRLDQIRRTSITVNHSVPPWSKDELTFLAVRPRPDFLKIPLYEGKVNAGQSRFASAAQDYEMKDLDFNEFLVNDPPATFVVQLDRDADSMIDAGILPGSYVTVDKGLASKAKSKDIVLAIVNGEYLVKRLYKRGSIVRLLSENKAKSYPPIEFNEGQELIIWGVVVNVVTKFV